MQVMKSIIINLDRRVTQQEHEIVDLRGRSMRDNIHRNGQKHPGNLKPRIITGKLKKYNDKEHILQVMRQQKEDNNSEGGNSFKAIASQVSSCAQVRNFYRRVLRDREYPSANHNILVYRFTGSEGLVHDGYQDNGEYGAGRRILKELCDQNVSNAVVIVSRINGKLLGPRRFQIMKDIATSAVEMV